ncbi:MAG: oligosaccharide flippase family protein [Bacillota bacterium]
MNRKSSYDVISLGISQLIAVFMAFGSQLLLTRNLSVSDYGAISTALSITGIVGTFAGFGAGPNWLRVFGKEGRLGLRWVKPSLIICGFSVVIAELILMVIVLFGNLSRITDYLIIMFTLLIVQQGITPAAEAVYQLEGKYKKLAMLKTLLHSLRFFLTLSLVFWGATTVEVGLGFVVASLLMIIIQGYLIFRIIKGRVSIIETGKNGSIGDLERVTYRDAFHYMWPYAMANVFYLLYYQFNILIISMMLGDAEAGIYNVAFTVMTVVFLFPVTLYQGYLIPKIHRWIESDKSKISQIFDLGGRIATIFGILMMGLVASNAIWVVPLVFGKNYVESAYSLIILSLALPFRLISNNIGSILVTEGNIIKKVQYQGYGAALSILLTIVLIYELGIYGAAIATVITECFVSILFYYGCKKHVPQIVDHKSIGSGKYFFSPFVLIGVTVLYYISIYQDRHIITFSIFLLFITLLITAGLTRNLIRERKFIKG